MIQVTGPRGTLERSFKFFKIDLSVVGSKQKKVRAELWLGQKLQIACIRSVTSAIKNMFTGVTKGFEWKMRCVYAHFPITVSIEKDGREVAVRNYLGEKMPRIVELPKGVQVPI